MHTGSEVCVCVCPRPVGQREREGQRQVTELAVGPSVMSFHKTWRASESERLSDHLSS